MVKILKVTLLSGPNKLRYGVVGNRGITSPEEKIGPRIGVTRLVDNLEGRTIKVPGTSIVTIKWTDERSEKGKFIWRYLKF